MKGSDVTVMISLVAIHTSLCPVSSTMYIRTKRLIVMVEPSGPGSVRVVIPALMVFVFISHLIVAVGETALVAHSSTAIVYATIASGFFVMETDFSG